MNRDGGVALVVTKIIYSYSNGERGTFGTKS